MVQHRITHLKVSNIPQTLYKFDFNIVIALVTESTIFILRKNVIS